MHSIEYTSEINKIRMIACLAIILPLTLLFFVFPCHSVWLLSPVPTFSLISSWCVCNTTARGICDEHSTFHVGGSSPDSVKVIHRRERERTIEKTTHIVYKYISRFPLNTTYRCSLTNYLSPSYLLPKTHCSLCDYKE